MAGVVFAPQRQPGILTLALRDLLGGAINGMFQRDQAAKQYELDKRTAEDELVRKQTDRTNQATHIQENVAPWLRDNAEVSRDNPTGNYLSMAFGNLMGVDPAVANIERYLPNMQAGSVNRGDVMDQFSFDPLTGERSNETTSAIGLSPDQKYESDKSIQRAQIAAGPGYQGNAIQQAYNDARLEMERQAQEREQSNLYNKVSPAGVDENGNAVYFNDYSGYRESEDKAPMTQAGPGDYTGKPFRGENGNWWVMSQSQGPVDTGQPAPEEQPSIDEITAAVAAGGFAGGPEQEQLKKQMYSRFGIEGSPAPTPAPAPAAPIAQAATELTNPRGNVAGINFGGKAPIQEAAADVGGGEPPAQPKEPKRYIDITTRTKLENKRKAEGGDPSSVGQELYESYLAGEIDLAPSLLQEFKRTLGGPTY